jgi:hypothetical protein
MQGLAKERLTAEILNWLPQGHIVIVDTPRHSEDSVVIGWMNAYGATSIAEVTFEEKFMNSIQQAINENEDLLNPYLEKLKQHVLALAAAHEDGRSEPWHFTHNLL